jgi:hypothetical protein
VEILSPKYRRDPNQMVDSIYQGVTHGNQTVTTVLKPSADRNSLEATKTIGPALPRGQGGQIGVLILGGMETTLDEMEDILEAKRQKKFVPRRGPGEIADMCRYLIEQRNDKIRHYRKNPSEAPQKRPTRRLHLPSGYRMANTAQPGLRVLAQI